MEIFLWYHQILKSKAVSQIGESNATPLIPSTLKWIDDRVWGGVGELLLKVSMATNFYIVTKTLLTTPLRADGAKHYSLHLSELTEQKRSI